MSIKAECTMEEKIKLLIFVQNTLQHHSVFVRSFNIYNVSQALKANPLNKIIKEFQTEYTILYS